MDLFSLQEKIRRGYQLTSAEEAFLIKSADSQGRVSRRQFIGLAEYPNSQVDLTE